MEGSRRLEVAAPPPLLGSGSSGVTRGIARIVLLAFERLGQKIPDLDQQSENSADCDCRRDSGQQTHEDSRRPRNPAYQAQENEQDRKCAIERTDGFS